MRFKQLARGSSIFISILASLVVVYYARVFPDHLITLVYYYYYSYLPVAGFFCILSSLREKVGQSPFSVARPAANF